LISLEFVLVTIVLVVLIVRFQNERHKYQYSGGVIKWHTKEL